MKWATLGKKKGIKQSSIQSGLKKKIVFTIIIIGVL